MKYIILLCWKCWIYNTGSAQLLVLCTSLVPMLDPFATSVGGFWTIILKLGGAKGVLLKSKLPSIIRYAKIFGLRLEGLIMFNMICSCSIYFFIRCIEGSLSVPHRTEKICFLRVLLVFSTTFLLCMSGGANW